MQKKNADTISFFATVQKYLFMFIYFDVVNSNAGSNKENIEHLRNCEKLQYEEKERQEILKDNGKRIDWLKKALKRRMNILYDIQNEL